MKAVVSGTLSNPNFDMSFIMENCGRLGYPQEFTYVDTVGYFQSTLRRTSQSRYASGCGGEDSGYIPWRIIAEPVE